jgi:hypothetical protein
MIERIKGVLFLDSEAFKEIEHDDKATGQAALIVVVASILAALGVAFGPVIFSPDVAPTVSPILKLIGVVFWGVVAWLVWSAITYFIGTKIFHGQATYGEILRVVGFAYAPMAFLIFSAIPVFGMLIALLASAWTLGAVFIGLREGLDLDFGPTLATVFIGWFIYAIGMGILFSLFDLI